MGWVTWRHHRIALGGVAVFLGALAVWLWIVGLQLHHAYAAAIDCHPVGSVLCSEVILNFDLTGGMLKGGFVLQPVPALIGAFLGPLVLARELETGNIPFCVDPSLRTAALGRRQAASARRRSGCPRRRLRCGGLLVLPAVPRDRQALRPDVSAPSLAFRLTRGLVGRLDFGRLRDRRLRRRAHRRVVPAIVATLASYTVLGVVVGDVLRADYQPASDFWSVQGIEAGGLLALSLLLIAATVWQVHRRAA